MALGAAAETLGAQEIYQAVGLDMTDLEAHVIVARARGDEQVRCAVALVHGDTELHRTGWQPILVAPPRSASPRAAGTPTSRRTGGGSSGSTPSPA